MTTTMFEFLDVWDSNEKIQPLPLPLKIKFANTSTTAHRLCKKSKFLKYFKLLPIYTPIRIKNQIASPIYRYK